MPIRSLSGRTAPRLALALLAFLLLGSGGCATDGGKKKLPSPAISSSANAAPTISAADYAAQLAALQAGDFTRLEGFRAGWLAQPDVEGRLARLADLEQQALQMFDQPLRLGAIGAAILDLYPASLLGAMASNAYYERVGGSDDAERFRKQADAVAAHLQGNRAGTPNAALPMLSLGEASAYLRRLGITPLGTLYAAPRAGGLHLSIIGGHGHDKPLVTTAFDLTDTYYALRPDARSAGDDNARLSSLQRFIGDRLRMSDSAAQTFLALTLMSDPRSRGTALQLLQQAVTDGNLYARLLLVQAMLGDYSQTPEPQRKALLEAAEHQLEQAVAAGSEAAMVELGRLLISDLFGPEGGDERAARGLAHVQRAAALQHVPAMLVLASMYAEGTRPLTKDPVAALEWLRKAASIGDADARLAYIRFQLEQTPSTLDATGLGWLRELAAAEHLGALFIVGSLHARGEHLPLDLRLARKLFQQVAGTDPTNPESVNNVAWTLAVTDIGELRDPRRALDIMSRMMEANEAAKQNPAYLDTWAAAYAANGKFERAVELQEMALKAAEAQDDDSTGTAKVLREHLEAFRRGEPLTEKVP